VLVAAGGVVGGYALYVQDGRPTYEYNFITQERSKVTGSQALVSGPNVVRMEFRYDGGGLGKGGTAALFVNDVKVGEGRIERTGWARFSADETFDVGEDTGSPVSADYASPSPFTGTVKKIVVDIQPATLTAADERTIRSAEDSARIGAE
jgi:arylsulfatase